ncbi:PREDICTED: ferric reduction oxidase 2-like [Lupinus angustifolius]|uniref:ferric reduction oxidase 2-like n=1 Tax=Lupinus angustifolius TaxID=3871 RepID=UPI00092EB9DE|nr:PREDICTED: ferric reduction oxidase 2-like [Lupinus angustifolius]
MADQETLKKSPSQEKYGKVQSAIKILFLVLFVGWIFIWIMVPTNIERNKWLPQIRRETNSTYYGIEGASFLIYTSPFLLMAVLGCVYLHIAKKSNDSNMESCNVSKLDVAICKRPVLVKGPLGIVSGTELAFLLMFIALLIWSFAKLLHNGFVKITPQLAAKDGQTIWQEKLDSVALRIGLVGNICLAFLFFPVARGSSVLPFFGLTSEGSIKYHIWLGHIVMTLFTIHGLCYIIFWAVTNQISQMLKWDKVGISNLAGEIALIFGLIMWIATIPRIRRKFFELFFYTHYLYILFIVFFIFHVGITYACLMLPSFYLFLVDRYIRFLQSRHQVRLVSARVLPCEAIELNFSKDHGLTYNPTSVMFINIPSISKLQWHPFTVTSNSNLEPEKLSVVIKSGGTWTQNLYKILSNDSAIDRLSVSVEGPYGPASTDFLRHDTLVLISGGSGITPFISIIRELIFLKTIFKCKTPKVVLICSFRTYSSLSMTDLILPISSTPYDISNLELQIEAYITKDKDRNIVVAVTATIASYRNCGVIPNHSDATITACELGDFFHLTCSEINTYCPSLQSMIPHAPSDVGSSTRRQSIDDVPDPQPGKRAVIRTLPDLQADVGVGRKSQGLSNNPEEELETEEDYCMELVYIEDSIEVVDLSSDSKMEEDPSECPSTTANPGASN